MIFVDQQLYKTEIGIYKITNMNTGEIYTGKTDEAFQERFWHHRWLLRDGTHHNRRLQKDWDSFGEDSFEFSVVEICGKDALDNSERKWIQHFREIGSCYNIQDGGHEVNLSQYVTQKHRKIVGEKNRQRLLGSKLPEETKKRMSDAHKGRRIPKSTDVITVDQAREAKESLISGKRPSDIARELGVPYRAINNILSNDTFKDVEVDGWVEFRDNRTRKRHGVSEDEIATMKKMYSEGALINDIAKKIGCTRHTVRKYLTG